MSAKRTAEAAWIKAESRWKVNVQKNGRRRSFYSSIKGRKGKHEAEAKADTWLESGTEDMRFPEAWAQYLDHCRSVSESAYQKAEQYGRLYIVPNIGARKLSAVTPLLWQACIDAGAKKKLSRRSCVNIRAAITAFVRYALRARWSIQRLEDGDLRIPASAPAKPEKRVIQPDVIRLLFADPTIRRYGRAALSPYSYMWQLIIATGLRRGEAAGLQWSDIAGNTLTINRSINYLNEITDCKNANARRTIAISHIMSDILNRQREYLKSQGIISPWIFPTADGDQPDPNQVYDHWRTWCAQHDVHASIHELRHTFISINKTDMPLELMKATVGHSESMNTYGVYGHEIEGERERAAQIIDGIFNGILNSNAESVVKSVVKTK